MWPMGFMFFIAGIGQTELEERIENDPNITVCVK